MNIIAKHTDLPIAAIGDIHGIFDVIKEKVKQYNLTDFIIFSCGDFGVGFGYNNPREEKKEHKKLSILNDFLNKRNIFLYVVRGNHDNPIFYDGNHNFSNIIFMQDYDIVEVGNLSILGIGGATSVDRKPNYNFFEDNGKHYKGRKENVNWWSNEKVFYYEEKINCIAGVDVIIAHTCPSFAFPSVFNEYINKWIQYDQNLKDDLLNERNTFSKIFNKLGECNVIKYFIYGHYHKSNFEIHDNTKFKLLDINEFYEIKI